MAHTETSVTELTYGGRTIGSAVIVTRRVGQQAPATSDSVEVEVELRLPAASADAPQTLHPELVFGDRVQVFAGNLDSNWSAIAGRVARSQSYTGTDYAALFTTAQTYAATELAKLTDALTVRQAALDAAG
jgi:hypothetical protein